MLIPSLPKVTTCSNRPFTLPILHPAFARCGHLDTHKHDCVAVAYADQQRAGALVIGMPSMRDRPPRQSVLHIVPALPPLIDGLGDYATTLAQELVKLGVNSRFVAAGMPPATGVRFEVGDFQVQVVREQKAEALAEALETAGVDTVLLHFVGYGYARRGLCFWLVEGLQQWKSRSPGRHLVTMFHELYASGPPWRTSFWTSLPQRRIARILALGSDAIVCGYALIEGRLRAWRPTAEVRRMSVFSNVGELTDPSPLEEREPVAVAFGGAGPRRRLYDRLRQQGDLLSQLAVEQIVDIGPPIEVPAALGGIPIRPLGILPSADVSAIMSRARVGLGDYPFHVVAKSGILAAYHAHGLLCVNLSLVGRLVDDIVEGRHFVGVATLKKGCFDAEAIAARGHQWYRGHDRARTARVFADVTGAASR